MSEATCKTCPWFKPYPGSNAYPDQGGCHKNAPAIDQEREYFGQGAWPLILFPQENWCGEHPERRDPS